MASGVVCCDFFSLSYFQSGSSKKKPADSEGGVKASGEGEGKGKGKGTMREMNKPPDQPESTIVVRRD